jgi:hypothetical protein
MSNEIEDVVSNITKARKERVMKGKHLVWILALGLVMPATALASEEDMGPPTADEQGVLDRIMEACPEAAPGALSRLDF